MEKLVFIFLMTISAFCSVGQETLSNGPKITPESNSSDTYKDYFFDEKLQINDSTSLVILIEDAQSQMSTELGHRIYEDTLFIRKIKSQFYNVRKVGYAEVVHFCGHDMYFYALCGGQLTYLNRLNSSCGLSDINCEDLGILFESGRKLRIDTLTYLPRKYKKSRDELFTKNVILSRYENADSWDICRSSKFPKMYYEGYFKTEITLDTTYTIHDNIVNFIRQYSSDFKNLNWNIWSDSDQVFKFNYSRESTKIELSVYLKKQLFNDFRDFDIRKVEPIIDMQHKLLIFYDD